MILNVRMSSDHSCIAIFLVTYLNDQLEYHATCVPLDSFDPLYCYLAGTDQTGLHKTPVPLAPGGGQPMVGVLEMGVREGVRLGHLSYYS